MARTKPLTIEQFSRGAMVVVLGSNHALDEESLRSWYMDCSVVGDGDIVVDFENVLVRIFDG